MLKYLVMIQNKSIDEIKRLSDEELNNFADVSIMNLPFWNTPKLFDIYKKITDKLSENDKKILLQSALKNKDDEFIIETFNDLMTEEQFLDICKSDNLKYFKVCHKYNKRISKSFLIKLRSSKISDFIIQNNLLEETDEFIYEFYGCKNPDDIEEFFKKGYPLHENIIELVLTIYERNEKLIFDLIAARYKISDLAYVKMIDNMCKWKLEYDFMKKWNVNNTKNLYERYLKCIKDLIKYDDAINLPCDVFDKLYNFNIHDHELICLICEKRKDLRYSHETFNKIYLSNDEFNLLIDYDHGISYFKFYVETFSGEFNKKLIGTGSLTKNKLLLKHGYKWFTEKDILKMCLLYSDVEICKLYFGNDNRVSESFIKTLVEYKKKKLISELVNCGIINENELCNILISM